MNRSPIVALAASLATLLPAQSPTPAADAAVLATALNKFGADLAARSKDPNLCQSPASIGLCLLMTLPGARGATAVELQKLLCPEGWDDKRTLAAARLLLAHLRGSKAIELSVVNNLWPQKQHPLLAPFLAATKTAFDTEVRPLDYVADPAAARKTINDYVFKATRERISDLLPPDAVGEDTRLILTNALYLKAEWRDKFEGTSTRDGFFQLADGSKAKVPFMHRQGQYELAEVAGLQVLRLPYVDQEFAFDVALPAKDSALATAEAALRPEGMASWTASLKAQQVKVSLPRFRVEGSFNLIGPLRAMGLVQATTANQADFTGIDGGLGKLYIGEVVHKTFLDVAEKGTEAAAATAVVMRTGADMRTVPTFTADRPFAYVLRDLSTGLVLFAGRVGDPRGPKS